MTRNVQCDMNVRNDVFSTSEVFQDHRAIEHDYGALIDDHNIGGDVFEMQCRLPIVQQRRVAQQRNRAQLSDDFGEDFGKWKELEEAGDIQDEEDGTIESEIGLK